jgi:plastocyanin
MRAHRLVGPVVIVMFVVGVAAAEKIRLVDNCDPADPGWAATSGCLLEEGDVPQAEFRALLSSPHSLSVVGHPSWRNEPSYLTMEAGETLRVRNEGGRGHTFTKVAEFGGGKIANAALNKGLTTAPECPDSIELAPGETVKISGLELGLHRFQCCIHPWMRAAVRVTPN